MELSLSNVAAGHGDRTIVKDISLTIRSGDVFCLLGPNGVGKTTLFKTILGLQPILGGRIRLDGQDIGSWSHRQRARRLGYVPQAHTPPFPFTVADVVATGRAAHFGPFAGPSRADRAIAAVCLEKVGAANLGDAAYTAISGGERQLVLIARALAQQPSFLFMDEPTSNLDYGNQIRILNHVRALAETEGMGVVMTTHDPNDALTYGSAVAILMPGGRLLSGSPDRIITRPVLEELYDAPIRMIPTDSGIDICAPGR